MNFPTVGVVGAGQLARMMLGPATNLGINVQVFASSDDDSAAQVTDSIVGDYTDELALLDFARSCDVVTFEHELVPQNVIRFLEKHGVKIFPSAETFIYSQDKIAMREKMKQLGLPNPRYQRYDSGVPNLSFPFIAKAPQGGYDGKGVWVIENQGQLDALPKPLLLEEKVDFSHEISIMVARSPSGEIKTWSPTLTVQRDGICIRTVTPVPELPRELELQIRNLSITIAEGIALIGVMAVELFQIGNLIMVNELALRPHNSGHWTIEGAVTSQFEQHLRAVLDLPLGDTTSTADWAVMGNILGGNQTDMFGHYGLLMARNPNLKFHHYRKEMREGRKIGHVLLIGNDCELAGLEREVEYAVDYLSGVINE